MNSQLILNPQKNGLNVNQLKKSGINLVVAPVGLLEQLKQCLIDYVFLQVKKTKEDYQLKICFPVAQVVDLVVMVGFLNLHGVIL